MGDYNQRSRRSRIKSSSSQVNLRDPKTIFLVSRITKYVFFGLVALVVLTPILFLWFSRDLPTPGKLVSLNTKNSSGIYDRNGTLLYSVYTDQNRTYVALTNVPKTLQEATIAIEDKDFYKNNGFSPIGYVRVLKNFLSGKGLAGASTITQQLVKIALLQDARRTPSRKIKEFILAIQVNKKYSKDQILEMYLNNIPYGGAAVGIEAASETYFGKKANDLSLAESALLAGLPQSPSVYSPFSGNKYYIDRSKAVLKQMTDDGYITQKDSDTAFASIQKMTFSQHATGIKAPHFVMYVKEKIAEQFGEQALEGGGLKITTTLDYKMQEKAEAIVKDEINGLKTYRVSNGAAMVTDPKTGEILTMVGSKDYFDENNQGNFNVAVKGNRQPGSSLKPIIYATAFEKGYTPATVLMDVKTNFTTGDTQPAYSPVNYDGKFHGPVQVRFALANSMNIPAVKMLAKVGIKPAMQKAYDMGITEWEPTTSNMANVGLSLVLGGRETTLMHEMEAYGVFANRGVKQDLVGILKVEDGNGHVLYEYKKKDGPQVLSPEISFLISHILLDNNARALEFGTSSSLVVRGKTVSVKTGTTDEKRDNWTMGYTPSYVVGVWVGNNDNSPMNQAIASGITGASPIWNKIMSEVLKGKPDEQPYKPDDVNALQIDSLAGGLPHGGQATRSEYFIKGTEPTTESPVYKSKDGKQYVVFQEDDPVSTDGKNRWQEGITAWIDQNHKGDELWNPPDELKAPGSGQAQQVDSTPTPTTTLTPTPTATP
jgi:1A family penicillin-binding protein